MLRVSPFRMSNGYPQQVRVGAVYLGSRLESEPAGGPEEVANEALNGDSNVGDLLFSTQSHREASETETDGQRRYEGYFVCSEGALAQRDDETWAFNLPSKGDLTQYWAEDLMGEGASLFQDEWANPGEPPGDRLEGIGISYNYWASNTAYWQDLVDGIDAPPIVHKTHHAVKKTLESPMRETIDSPGENIWSKVDTTVAEDICIDETETF
jgi:hypothetical protein|nr:MAG: hypothetical protein J07AB56_00920 [Candidatus Nanosalinarum sp. J07AB56]